MLNEQAILDSKMIFNGSATLIFEKMRLRNVNQRMVLVSKMISNGSITLIFERMRLRNDKSASDSCFKIGFQWIHHIDF